MPKQRTDGAWAEGVNDANANRPLHSKHEGELNRAYIEGYESVKGKVTIYDRRDIEEQGGHYMRHLDHMTREGLHSKGDIAAELAHRDILIEQLRKAVALARPELHALYFQLTHKRLEEQDNTDCVKRAVDALDAAVDATKTTVP